MKFLTVVPIAALTSAFVLPSEQVFDDVAIENHRAQSRVEGWYEHVESAREEVLAGFNKHIKDITETSKKAWNDVSSTAQSALDEAFRKADATVEDASGMLDGSAQDVQSWMDEYDDVDMFDGDEHYGKHPHKRPHHGKPNQTIYQLIAGSKYTTKLAELISEYDDLVDALNSTSANFTVFAPTDRAFEKIPEKAPKPSKEQLKAILSYHVVPDVYPAGRVLSTHTAPTLLKGEHLSSEPEPQRITFRLGLRGLSVNFYSRIVAVNIFATNGVIHGVDSILLPPPQGITLIDLLPGEFSTLELALGKTGLHDKLNTTKHAGGTLFAPNNFAFKKLGPRINAFLFSEHGLKYLKALLEYHVVPATTLYSDAIYQAKPSEQKDLPKKGHFEIDLPTLLDDRSLRVDVARFYGIISVKINGFVRPATLDVVAEDGVIHILRDVLIPPKRLSGAESEEWDGSELSVEDLMERLEPMVTKEDL